MWSVLARFAPLMLATACGEPAAHVQLVPVNPCGQVANNAVRVIAYTAGGELRRTVPPEDIDAFPRDTEQLGAEVIGNGGALVAIGKTAPLDFANLAEGTTIPIVMAPPDGMCPTIGTMTEVRIAPAVAHAGNGVLIVGGTSAAGQPLATAEYYDAATMTFSAVEVPASLADAENGLAGAVLTELDDGRVALSGTSSHALALFAADTHRFTTPELFDHRAFHGAVAPDGEHLFVIGGCAEVAVGTCSGPALHSGFEYLLADVTMRDHPMQLPDSARRFGAQVYDVGVQLDGAHRYVLAGGFGDAGVADRFAIGDAASQPVADVHAQTAPLAGGALVTAFDPDGATQTGAAGVIVPDGAVTPIAFAPKLDGMRLASLEDGTVLALGPAAARYVPTTNAWQTFAVAGMPPPSLMAPVTIRLVDGSVLVVGGSDPSAQAWIYRPPLVGASSGSITALSDGSAPGVLVASDPARVDRTTARFLLAGGADDYRARALLGAPVVASARISAGVTVHVGGVALIAQQTGPGHALVGRLVPGEQARIEQLASGSVEVLCSGAMVDAGELAAGVHLTVTDGSATLAVGPIGATTTKATCAVTQSERGAWGVAAAGKDARIEIGSVAVERLR